MKILISGSHGFIGIELARSLLAKGHEVSRLVRERTSGSGDEVLWDPLRGTIEASRLEGFDGIVHLAGENIANERWTEEKKRLIRESRVRGTRFLAETISKLGKKPGVVITASAIGYYGDRGEERLYEESPPGTGFLASVCEEWEASVQSIINKGIRVVPIRIGVVLSPKGGALAKMLPVFRKGLGGILGSGKQYVSWVALDDVLGAINHCLEGHRLNYPINLTSPNSVTNAEFTKTLGKVLGKPTLARVPAFALKILMGEFAHEALLASARVSPACLLKTGYQFKFPTLEGALQHLVPNP